jgi:hypothetical protein
MGCTASAPGGFSEIRQWVPVKIQEAEFALLQKAVTEGVEPAGQAGHLQGAGFDPEAMMNMTHDCEIPVPDILAFKPISGPGLDPGGLVPGGGPALAAEPGADGEQDLGVEGFGQNNSGPGAYNRPEGIVGPVEFQEPVAVDELEAPVSETDDFGFARGAAPVPLVHEPRGPDIMVAADEVDPGCGLLDPVQTLEDGVITFQAEMGIVEPEIEDVSQQDEVVRLGGQLEKIQEPVHPLELRLIGDQMKMGIGHDNGRGLFQIIHAA